MSEGRERARIWHFSWPLSLCVLLVARLRGLGRSMEVGTWFGQIFNYSGDSLTCNSNAGGEGTFAFIQSSALMPKIFWMTLTNPFLPDSVMDLKNWDYGTESHCKTLSDLRMENFKELGFTVFFIIGSITKLGDLSLQVWICSQLWKRALGPSPCKKQPQLTSGLALIYRIPGASTKLFSLV